MRIELLAIRPRLIVLQLIRKKRLQICCRNLLSGSRFPQPFHCGILLQPCQEEQAVGPHMAIQILRFFFAEFCQNEGDVIFGIRSIQLRLIIPFHILAENNLQREIIPAQLQCLNADQSESPPSMPSQAPAP